MKTYLSIDSGGTKTKYLLCDESGRFLATTTLATAHYLQVGLAGLTANLKTGIQAVCQQANITANDIAAAFFAAAGYGDIPEDEEKITKAAQVAFGSIKFQVGNDCENALIGSLAGQAGINIVAGTGSIGLGFDNEGQLFRSGGWHHIYGGDEGSAYWLACHLIQEFTKQADHRKPKTYLYHYLRDTYQFKHDSDILVMTIEQWNFEREKVATLAKDVYNCAKAGDEYCLDLYKQAANELAEVILAIKNTLTFQKPIKLSYSGGVFQAGDLILAPLAAALDDEFTVIEPLLSPEAGGIILALRLDNQEINPTILNNLAACK